MRRFSTRLSFMFILLIGLSLVSAGLLVIRVVENSHLKAAEDAMERELRLLVRELATPADDDSDAGSGVGSAGGLARYERFAADTDRLLGARVTIIGSDGTVLADSRLSPGEMDNHAGREEIREASADGIGFSLRQSESLDRKLLYAAMPIAAGESGEPAAYVRIAFGMDMLEQTKDRLRRLVALWLLAFMLIAGLISYRIAKGLSRPLERAVRVARKIARQQLDARLPEGGKDEFAQLSRAINVMADSLQSQMEAARAGGKRLASVLDKMISGVMLIDSSGTIQLANRKAEDMLGFSARELVGRTFGDVRGLSEFPPELTALVRICLERREPLLEELTFHYPEERIIETSLVPIGLQEENDGIVIVLHDITEIRHLERVRSQFVANVSHELRTPVAAIRGYAETLKAGAMNDAEIADSFLQIIIDESRRLGRLIEDILDLSNIESKQVALHFAPVDLRPFIGKMIGTVQPAADKNRLRLTWQVEDHLHIEADEDKLGQIVINLLSNAIAYTPEGGSVYVTARAVPGGSETGDDERVRIEVRDTGIGIPRKDLPRIFERFYRVDKARSRGSGGTGLGLSIVKHLVELHHGSITVESKPGAGSVFIVELPVIQPWDES
jgi:two-component system phosphate regulon sensor histidine kinase PhoR